MEFTGLILLPTTQQLMANASGLTGHCIIYWSNIIGEEEEKVGWARTWSGQCLQSNSTFQHGIRIILPDVWQRCQTTNRPTAGYRRTGSGTKWLGFPSPTTIARSLSTCTMTASTRSWYIVLKNTSTARHVIFPCNLDNECTVENATFKVVTKSKMFGKEKYTKL